LIGWWPLAPSSSALPAQPGDCTLAQNGLAATQAPPGACLVADLGANHYNGARNGGAWVSAGAQFGNALLFQGGNHGALYQPDIVLSDFENGENPAAIPVTLSAYVYVDSVPSQQQVILADVFHPGNRDNMTALIALMIDRDGHVMARYQSMTSGEVTSSKTTKDEKPISAGHWVHYGVVLWYDANSGVIADKYMKTQGLDSALLLFRDAQKVKGAVPLPGLGSLDAPANLAPGFYLGGLDPQEPLFSFVGRVDEVRLWARALYGPQNKNSYLSAQLDLWRRLPGTAFDEYVYWSFDDDLGRSQNQPCNVGDACDHSDPRYKYPAITDDNGNVLSFPLIVDGPSWAPNDFSISYATQAAK